MTSLRPQLLEMLELDDYLDDHAIPDPEATPVADDETPRCWWCGAEPEEVHELRNFDGKVRDLLHWPPGDHEHRRQPPTNSPTRR